MSDLHDNAKPFWRITICDRGKETEFDIPVTHISEKRIGGLVQMLYAKRALTDKEIIDSHKRTNVRSYRNTMPVHSTHQKDLVSYRVALGSVHVSAVVIRPNGNTL